MRPLLSSVAFLCLLALPLAAQEEALYGTWESPIAFDELGEGTMRLTFEADGTFDLDLVVDVPGGMLGMDEIPDDEFLDEEAQKIVEMISALEGISAHGTYQVTGDSLWVYSDDGMVEYIVDGESVEPVEFWTPVFRFSARIFAVLAAAFGEEISEEDYEAFEQAIVDEMLAELDAEPLGFTLSGTYSIDGDTLFITAAEEDGVETVETLEFQRIDDATAVVQTTWGSLKAAWRP